MTRSELEFKYLENGCTEFKLRNLSDLKTIHDIDFENVPGYSTLDDLNRKKYRDFIVNFFNRQWLEERGQIRPIAINYVEEITSYIVEGEDQTVVGGKIFIIKRDGSVAFHSERLDEAYKGYEIKYDPPERYLMFEYSHGDAGNSQNEWVHVTNDGQTWF